jgi:hypothetical protein
MVMFTAYFDASGDKRSRVLTVAGFVARVKKWERFEDRWASILTPYGLDNFHMTDFVTGVGKYAQFKGAEHKWKRVEFFSSLVDCIKQSTQKGFAVSVQMGDYVVIDKEYKLSESVGKPYVLCGTVALQRLKDWAEKKKIDYRSVLCVFEDGDEHRGELIENARHDGFNAVLQSKKLIRAFDACDLAAWKAKSAIDDTLNRKLYKTQGGEKIKRSLEQLGTIVQDNGMYSSKSLFNICTMNGVARRDL